MKEMKEEVETLQKREDEQKRRREAAVSQLRHWYNLFFTHAIFGNEARFFLCDLNNTMNKTTASILWLEIFNRKCNLMNYHT